MHIFTHPACLAHRPGPDPDYAPQRLLTVIEALRALPSKNLQWAEAPAITRDDLLLAHTASYIDAVLQPIPAGEERAFDHETSAMSGTAEAALHAAGLVMAATEAVINGHIDKAFCVVSPGGHHAEADMASGYCFFNHVALAAIAAQKKMGVTRVAVVDFDVHHGNGMQSLFWNNADRLFISLHEDKSPTGLAHETGFADNILNIPLVTGSDGTVVQQAVIAQIIPKLTAFQPEIILVSAGFDMHRDDPMGTLHLATDDYFWLGRALRDAADRLCRGRLVSVLEGGYNLSVLGLSVAAFVRGLMKDENGA